MPFPCLSRQKGFTLIELMIALSIAAMVFVLSGPSLQRFYDAMEYRDAVRQIVSAARNAKRDAYISGEAIDLLIDADRNLFGLSRDSRVVSREALSPLPDSLNLESRFCRRNLPRRSNWAPSAFTPREAPREAKSLSNERVAAGTHLTIDWLLGEVTQQSFSLVMSRA